MEIFKLEAFVEDKNLGRAKRALAGLVLELKDYPVINAKATSNGGMTQVTNGNLVDMFASYLAKERLTKANAGIARAFLQSVGKSPSSFTYILKKATDAKILKKTGIGAGTSYSVIERLK